MKVPSEQARLRSLSRVLEIRSRTLAALRRFFGERDFLEVETPARIPVPALELHIEAEPAGDHFLRTSPEFHMKRLLAAGYERIFQIGPCFRKGERGALHNPEYTMLEWYRTGADYRDILADTQALVRAAAQAAAGSTAVKFRGHRIDLAAEWQRLTVREAFQHAAGWDPLAYYDADRFNTDLVTKVEPSFPPDRPVVLMDYPAEAAAMSRLQSNNPEVAERWELYIGGVELANAFSELTDPVEQRRRMAQWSRERSAAGRGTYALDEAFLAALEAGMPPAGGAALGVDRLVVVLAGADSLDDVLPFREA